MTFELLEHFTADVNKFGPFILLTEGGYVVDVWEPRDGENLHEFAFDIATRIGLIVGNGSYRCIRAQDGTIVLYRAGTHRSDVFAWGCVQ